MVGIKSILVVDDDPVIGQMVARALESLKGIETCYYKEPDMALLALRALRPDLILLDWMMPQMDGLEFIRRMKLMNFNPPIPVFMLTGKRKGYHFEEACDAGVDGYLTKPVDLNFIKKRVEDYLCSYSN
ncbi:response regulator [Kiloniella sp. b19]|uniref:response regulator n=1 Tax=Kiloniella sp. GXU_MW_B19 TaxID=3141326 RepID=UPI0031DD973D